MAGEACHQNVLTSDTRTLAAHDLYMRSENLTIYAHAPHSTSVCVFVSHDRGFVAGSPDHAGRGAHGALILGDRGVEREAQAGGMQEGVEERVRGGVQRETQAGGTQEG
eukprot:6030511-Pyramimonas_sp.AAC.1